MRLDTNLSRRPITPDSSSSSCRKIVSSSAKIKSSDSHTDAAVVATETVGGTVEDLSSHCLANSLDFVNYFCSTEDDDDPQADLLTQRDTDSVFEHEESQGDHPPFLREGRYIHLANSLSSTSTPAFETLDSLTPKSSFINRMNSNRPATHTRTASSASGTPSTHPIIGDPNYNWYFETQKGTRSTRSMGDSPNWQKQSKPHKKQEQMEDRFRSSTPFSGTASTASSTTCCDPSGRLTPCTSNTLLSRLGANEHHHHHHQQQQPSNDNDNTADATASAGANNKQVKFIPDVPTRCYIEEQEDEAEADSEAEEVNQTFETVELSTSLDTSVEEIVTRRASGLEEEQEQTEVILLSQSFSHQASVI